MTKMRLLGLSVALLATAWNVPAGAETGLAHSCVQNIAGTLSACPSPRTWVRPTPDTVVLSCPPGTAAADCEWGDAAFQFRRFGDLAPNALVNVCTADIAPGPFAPPNRPVVDPACGDPCGCGNALDRKANVLKSAVVAATVGSFTVTPASGVSPLAATIAWNVPGATTCTASGSWTGAKAASGSQALTNLTANASYTLVCSATTTTPVGRATLSWVAPTQNTDGSPLTDLAGFRAVYGLSAGVLSSTVDIAQPGATTYAIENLTPATYFFAMKAYTTGGNESALSNVVSKAVAGTSTTNEIFRETRTVTVTPPTIPNPPTGLVVTNPTAYRLDLQLTPDLPRLFIVGTVPLGTQCDPNHRLLTLNRVPRASVALRSGVARPVVALAQCGE